MDHERTNLYRSLQGLENTDFKDMSIQELFDLRHDMLNLLNTLSELTALLERHIIG